MNQRMIFELSPKQLKYKDILNKDFIELEIYAISDINPNRNGSHFTLEALQDAVASGNFKNKPIVGFFDKGDFGEHDGKMRYDSELDENYWDTDYGERILGFIRESDKVEVVQKGGLNWIKFTCVLCVQYCYKQVRKLLKDKTKKVSVEIDVLDRAFVDGIEEIRKFNLYGVTILGSKNGVPVIEAIPDAHLSILEQLDEAVLEGQRKALCFAYNQMSAQGEGMQVVAENYGLNEKGCGENCNLSVDNNIEGECNMETQSVTPEMATAVVCDADPVVATVDENCCGDAPMGLATGEQCNVDATLSCEGNDGSANMGEEQCDGDGACADGEACATPVTECNACEDKTSYTIEEYNELMSKYSEACKELEECKGMCDKYSEEKASLETECGNYSEKLQKMEKDFADVSEKLAAAEGKLFSIQCESMKCKAQELMSKENVADEDRKEIEMKCEQGKYSCEEDMTKDVAYAIYKAKVQLSDKISSFSVPFVEPAMGKEKSKKTTTRAERLEQYGAGK